MIKNGTPFLQVPGNLLFMLNTDWFQPFKHTKYSIGVTYLVIQNLPRDIRFKPENIIIVSTIPGPKEPKHVIELDYGTDTVNVAIPLKRCKFYNN